MSDEAERPYSCVSFEYGYDLDGGGHEVEDVTEADHPWSACIFWDDPDYDCVGLSDIMKGGPLSTVFLFAQNSGHFTGWVYPDVVPYKDTTYVKYAQGCFNETDHECNCHGGPPGLDSEDSKKWLELTDSMGLSTEQLTAVLQAVEWEGTGDTSDSPYPLCKRCDGDGYVTSPGGEWAVYRATELPADLNVVSVLTALEKLLVGILLPAESDLLKLTKDEEEADERSEDGNLLDVAEGKRYISAMFGHWKDRATELLAKVRETMAPPINLHDAYDLVEAFNPDGSSREQTLHWSTDFSNRIYIELNLKPTDTCRADQCGISLWRGYDCVVVVPLE